MSERLQHSATAYDRALQMHNYPLIAFVEGSTDQFFYGEICSLICNSYDKKINYHLFMAKSHPSSKNTPGKKGVEHLFNYFNENNKLLMDFQGEKKVFVFFMDKDIDDLLGEQIDSSHVIYTKYYDVENHIVAEGNIIRGAASATGVKSSEVQKRIDNSDSWTYTMANKYLDYVSLCIFVQKYENLLKTDRNLWTQWNCRYGTEPSTPNSENNKRALSSEIYTSKYNDVLTLVTDLYREKKHLLVFKGKWYLKLLYDELENNSATSKEELLKCIQTTLDFNGVWAEHFKLPLIRLLETIGYHKSTTVQTTNSSDIPA